MIHSSQSTSVWDYKPWWCQPWSIVLTGLSVISGSWLLFHRYWLTGIVAVPMLVWMVFFVLVYPRLTAVAETSTNTVDRPLTDNLPKL